MRGFSMNIMNVTPSAVDKINTLCQETNNWAVSLNMKGGGCAGFEYDWGFCSEDEVQSGDEIIDTGNGKLVLGSHSIMFLMGTELDYVNEMFGSMFEIRNPNSTSSCGCGVSVNFDLEKLQPQPIL